MRRNAMRKNLRQSIWRSLGRYLAIVAIIALGASMFVGLLMTKTDMVATGQKYMDQQNMFDFRLISTYGWDGDNLAQIAELEGVADAEGVIYQDMLVRIGDREEDSVYRFYVMPETVNRIVLKGGRLPEKPNECLVDGYNTSDSVLGTVITLSNGNTEDSLENLTQQTFTVVGYVSTPLYMDMNRGTTSIGNGSLSGYVMVLPEVIDVDYYTEVAITIPGDYAIYSDAYNTALDASEESLKDLLLPIAQKRYDKIKQEAEKAYAEGLAEYEDGLKQFEEGKAEAEKELDNALAQLQSAQALIYENEKLLIEGEAQLAEGKATLEAGEKELQDGKAQLEQLKAAAYGILDIRQYTLTSRYELLKEQLETIDAEIAPLQAQSDAISAQIAQQDEQLNALDTQISQFDAQIDSLDSEIRGTQATLNWALLLPELNAELIDLLEARLQDLNTRRADAVAQRDALTAQRELIAQEIAEPLAQRAELEGQIAQYQSQRTPIANSLASVEASLGELERSRSALDAQFAPYEEEMRAGEQELEKGRQQLAEAEKELEEGRKALNQGKAELAYGWEEYEKGKAEAEAEFAKAEDELADAKKQLDTARREIDDLAQAEVFLMDRRTNIGYNSLDSSSDIVSGVSRVFPVFFLLVAALVCITTMTRMIDEERTQIGTLKALGYSNFAIINKYLVYAGSGAIVGCGLGVLVGSVAFPTILWEAYKILLYITDDIVLTFNWPLCAAVVGAYTAVMLFVTWYCCRRALGEQPAELIRPKAPDAGKKILLEYLPFWKRISFLNKVTIRNIFRYRQRLAMMLVGIGGCTALLLTGFGLRDSIVNVVDYQFEEITPYDMTVYFSGDQSAENQQAFHDDIRGKADALFYHQSSIELEFEDQTKEIYLISAEKGVKQFINFYSGDEELPMPGTDEVLLTVGTADALGIDVGEQIILRNADMQTLTLTVSGIYDNHVYNYAVVSPQTIEKQWGELPELQMAFVTAKDGVDAHELSAQISSMYNVLNVSVSEDLADMVGSMMDALDLVVIVIVACAGALAVIVLYNLTNININERIREIATIKVLGFNAKETAMYVFKENLSLTVIGSLVGLGLGYLLLLFVMSQIRIDMVWFKALAMPMSYVWAMVLTVLSAVLVDFVFYFKLDKINMAEALKSVE